jgi:hypothetical protein
MQWRCNCQAIEKHYRNKGFFKLSHFIFFMCVKVPFCNMQDRMHSQDGLNRCIVGIIVSRGAGLSQTIEHAADITEISVPPINVVKDGNARLYYDATPFYRLAYARLDQMLQLAD